MINNIFDPSNYTFTIFTFFPGTAALISFILGIIMLIHENYSKESIGFSFMTMFCLFFWLGGIALSISANNPTISYLWGTIEHIGVIFIPTALSYLCLIVTNKFKKYRVVFWSTFAFSLFFLFIVLFTKTLIIDSKKYFWGYYPQYGHFGFIFITLFILFLGFNSIILKEGLKEAKTFSEKKRMKMFIIAFLIACLGAVDFIPTFGIAVYPFGYLPIIITTIVLAKITWQYNLVDITPSFASNEIIRKMNDILVITDMKGFILLINPAAEKFFNTHERIVVNKHISTIINDPVLIPLKTKSFYENAVKLKNHEFICDHKNNKYRFMSMSSSMLKNSDQSPTGIIFTAKDNTEYKKAQNSIIKSYKTTQSILNNMPIGIMIVGLDKKIKKVNKAALGLLGVAAEEELVGDICHSKISPNEKGKCPIVDKGDKKATFETTFIGPDNKNVTLYKTALRTVINGEDVILESFIDITESKELEKQLSDYKEYLEQQVQERTSNLQGTNKQLLSEVNIRKQVMENLREKADALENMRKETIKRENDMIEIKKVINQLSSELNRPCPYSLSFLKNPRGNNIQP